MLSSVVGLHGMDVLRAIVGTVAHSDYRQQRSQRAQTNFERDQWLSLRLHRFHIIAAADTLSKIKARYFTCVPQASTFVLSHGGGHNSHSSESGVEAHSAARIEARSPPVSGPGVLLRENF